MDDTKDKHPGGRPTDYRDEYNEQARKLCLLGFTDKELADFFDVTEQTINNWKNEYPQFFESVKKGKDIADSEVASSFYHRAIGYSHPEEKIFQYEGEIITHDTIKHYPPDAGAALNWLKNRQPEKWRDKHEVEHSGNEEKPIFHRIKNLSVEELEQLDRISQKLSNNE